MEENIQNDTSKKNAVEIADMVKKLWSNKKKFFIVWIVVFILSCVWIFPQPRYYSCEVSISPESSEGSGGSLASIASNFGLNIGSMESSDAIYPELYPDLFSSNDFIVDLLDIKITTSDNSLSTDYYDYLKFHQKQNVLLAPFNLMSRKIHSMFSKPAKPIEGKNGKRFDPFRLTKDVDDIVKQVQSSIKCTYSKTTSVVTITVQDQDPLVCALLADSVKERLQDFITDYRTKKARVDYDHYKKLLLEAKGDYDKALGNYAGYSDSHRNAIDQTVIAKTEDNSKKMNLTYQTYSTIATQLQMAEAKIQERTPAFTTLKCASVPLKPAGPKRMIFVAAMLILSTMITACWLLRKELIAWF